MKFAIRLAIGIAALAFAGTAVAAPVKVGIAAEPYPPFTSPDASGTWVGWEIEIINAVCAAEALECEIVPTAWDGIIPALLSKRIDVIMNSMTINDERMKVIDFSDKYYNTPAVVVAAKDAEIAPTPEGLAGKMMGLQASTIHQAYAQKHFADTAAELRSYQTQDEANQDLASGRIDAIMADSIAMEAFVASEGGACCEIKGAVADDQAIFGLGIGAGLRKEDTELKAKINEGIAKILADGTYDTITAKYFKESIYGN